MTRPTRRSGATPKRPLVAERPVTPPAAVHERPPDTGEKEDVAHVSIAQANAADQSGPTSAELQDKAVFVRKAVMQEITVAGAGHYGSVFSAVEIFVSLYYGYLRLRPDDPRWADRDRFVLSKGHACSGVYPILADLGFFAAQELETYTRLGSRLGDHPDMRKVPGFDFSAGSLGHGLAIGLGIAEAQALRKSDSRTVVVMGDGEQNEGQIWEAGAYAGARKLANVLGIIDRNGVLYRRDDRRRARHELLG